MKKYIKIVEQVIKNEKMISFNDFLSQVEQQFGFRIIFDEQITQAIILVQLLQFQKNNFCVQFETKMNSVKDFISIIRSNKFISLRSCKFLQKQMNSYKFSYMYKIWQNIDTFIKCKKKDQFRKNFASIILNTDFRIFQSSLAQSYIKFWQNILHVEYYDKKIVGMFYSIFMQFQDVKTLLDIALIQSIQNNTGQLGQNRQIVQINTMLTKIANHISFEKQSKLQIKLETEYQKIIYELKQFGRLKQIQQLGIQLQVGKFGSMVNGFGQEYSDLDITILTNCYISEIKLLKLLKNFLSDILEWSAELIIPKNTPPLLSLSLLETNQQIRIDILINNYLGIINSRFLQVYSQISWIRTSGIILKNWGKKKRFISKDSFSSYSIILMFIGYLIEIGKINPIIIKTETPNFHHKRIKGEKIEQFDVYCQFQKKSNSITPFSKQNLYQLLKGFFFYYSLQGDHWKKSQSEQIISLDGLKDKQFQQNYIFTIKDPFDKLHNPARVKKNRIRQINKQFSQAYYKFFSEKKRIIAVYLKFQQFEQAQKKKK